jgi:dolichol-phosphate hexosyltransferase
VSTDFVPTPERHAAPPPGELAPPRHGHWRPWTGGRPVRLSILMPVFNEEATVVDAVEAVLSVPYPCEAELIVVDDGSCDRTPELLAAIPDARAHVFRHRRNLGKGAALRTAAEAATGTHVVPFDADLEYSPRDLPAMLEPILEGRCDVVYGARLFGVRTVYQSYVHALGNRLLTTTANLLYDAYLSDMHTCLKLLPRELFRSLDLSQSGFGLDTEITAKILKIGVRPFEVPVSYHSRSVRHGKKITWRDGVKCLQLLSRIRVAEVPETAVIPEPVGAEVEAGLLAAGATVQDVHTPVPTVVHWVSGRPAAAAPPHPVVALAGAGDPPPPLRQRRFAAGPRVDPVPAPDRDRAAARAGAAS